MPADPAVTRRALAEGIITLKDVEKARRLEQKIRKFEQGIRYTSDYYTYYSDWNAVCSNLAVLRASGRNFDNDYWKDYEHPINYEKSYCVTAFFFGLDAATPSVDRPSSETVDPSYGDGLFRRRVTIGLSGFPDWFAHAQAALRVYK